MAPSICSFKTHHTVNVTGSRKINSEKYTVYSLNNINFSVEQLNRMPAACGFGHSICLDDEGHAWGFGGHEFGQLGHAYRNPSPHPQEIEFLSDKADIIDIACGSLFSWNTEFYQSENFPTSHN